MSEEDALRSALCALLSFRLIAVRDFRCLLPTACCPLLSASLSTQHS